MSACPFGDTVSFQFSNGVSVTPHLTPHIIGVLSWGSWGAATTGDCGPGCDDHCLVRCQWSAVGAVAVVMLCAAAVCAFLWPRQGDDDDTADEDILGHRTAQREVAKKLRLRESHARSQNRDPRRRGGAVDEAKSTGLPSGQTRAKQWVVLDLGLPLPPSYDVWGDSGNGDRWSLEIAWPDSPAESKPPPLSLCLDDLRRLGASRHGEHSFHCVTGWSFEGLELTGVAFSKLLAPWRVDERRCIQWPAALQPLFGRYTARVRSVYSRHAVSVQSACSQCAVGRQCTSISSSSISSTS